MNFFPWNFFLRTVKQLVNGKVFRVFNGYKSIYIRSLFTLLGFFQITDVLTNSREKKESEGERYTQLNAEFQRIARRDKKVFLSEQCKEIEKNNRMGKTKSLFKKIRYTKGTFHAKMSTIKDRNGKDLIEVEEIKKRWQEDTEEKGLNELDNHDGVVIHLEPDILEYEIKWTLRSIR